MKGPDCAPRFDTAIVRPFWDAVAQGELRLPACSACGAWQWYPYEFIPCHPSAHHDWRGVPKTGTVFTHTTVHRNFLPGASADSAPYVSALVELDGVVGPRLATVLVNLGDRSPAIGMRVRLCPTPRSGYVAPFFEPEG
jgi:uncharacterized OB-fold protein